MTDTSSELDRLWTLALQTNQTTAENSATIKMHLQECRDRYLSLQRTVVGTVGSVIALLLTVLGFLDNSPSCGAVQPVMPAVRRRLLAPIGYSFLAVAHAIGLWANGHISDEEL